MALIWSKQTTGLPIRVRSAQPGQNFVSEYVLDIDIEKNAPNVHKEEKKPNTTKWHGAELSVTIEGNWTSHRQYVLAYLRQLAIVTPYAALGFRYISSHAAGSAAARNQDIQLHFARRAEVMPPLPRATKYHPSAAKENQLLVKDLLSNTREKTLSGFFNKEFTCINREHANRLSRELGAGFSASMHPKNVSDKQGARIQQLLASARFSDPSGECLSPAGEYNLRLGVMKELGPDWIASYASPALACGGHPLIVEACVSLGGRDVKPGFNVFRFANRIPLLFEGGADVATRCVQRLNWTTYKIDKNNDKIGVFVSIVSTKIPFKGTSKEYIGDENSEIAEAVDKAIKQCAAQLRGKIVRAQALKDRRARKKALTKYVPDCCNAIFTMIASAADADTLPHERARNYDEKEMLWPVDVQWEEEATQKARTREITAEILQKRLEECVEKIDNEEALEFSMQQNKDGLKQDVFLNPFSSFAHEYEPELRPGESGVAFRLLKKARLIA
jgi:DNA topoisomerase VI B subunit